MVLTPGFYHFGYSYRYFGILLLDIFDFINILNRFFFPVALLAKIKLHFEVCQFDLLNFLPSSYCNEPLTLDLLAT